jgi:hypothetical protein
MLGISRNFYHRALGFSTDMQGIKKPFSGETWITNVRLVLAFESANC